MGRKLQSQEEIRNSSALEIKAAPLKSFVRFEICLCADEVEVSYNGAEALVLSRGNRRESIPLPFVSHSHPVPPSQRGSDEFSRAAGSILVMCL